MARILAFGEIMLRLNPPGFERLGQATRLEMRFGGGEANVAVSCVQLGHEAAFVTALPDHEIGDACIARLRAHGVDTRGIVRRPGRIGIYFLENGASQRGSKVLYDRAGSVAAVLGPEAYDWPALLQGCAWFHTTGITPAISDHAAEAAGQAMRAARAAGATVSFDLNYRKKLWSREKARKTVEPLLASVDLLIGNEEDAKDVLGIEARHTDVQSGAVDRAAYREVCETIRDRYGVGRVAITLRESESASVNHWSAALLDGDAYHVSRRYTIQVVDRVGAGDSFCGGLIVALLDGRSTPDALEFAVAASCLKHTIPGDFNFVTRAEVDALLQGGGSGRVQR
jgi:2-dehydro-3-deoxygluconokinase